MKPLLHHLRLLPLALCLVSLGCAADQLVYTPVNPTFGGNPNNAAGLLAIANAQNDYKAPVADTTALTPLQKFNQTLLNSVLGKLNTNLLGDLFNKDGSLSAGNEIRSGNYQITIASASTADCGGTCPTGSLVLITQDVTIPGSSTRIVIGSN
jgi:curli production assembly/transport component CsgF